MTKRKTLIKLNITCKSSNCIEKIDLFLYKSNRLYKFVFEKLFVYTVYTKKEGRFLCLLKKENLEK